MDLRERNKLNRLIKDQLAGIGPDVLLYVNFPFCLNRCKYCIYHIDRYSPEKAKLFFDNYRKEIDLYSQFLPGLKFKEIHIGGGTPNLADPGDLVAPLEKLADFKKAESFLIEVFPNPGLGNFIQKLSGFNLSKITLGVQALNDQILRNENRFVSKSLILKNMETLSKSGISWAVDYILQLGGSGVERDHIAELKSILAFKPSGLHFYYLRRQKENGFYDQKGGGGRKNKFREDFNFDLIRSMISEKGYELIGDEWCLKSDIRNCRRAKKEADSFGETETVGLGLGARSRLGNIKYRTTKDLGEYGRLLSRGFLPIKEYFNYRGRLRPVADVLLSVNQQLTFDLREIMEDATQGEISEMKSFLSFLKKKVDLKSSDGKFFFVPQEQFTRCLGEISGYLRKRGGRDYFYKN